MFLNAEQDPEIPLHKVLPFANVDGIGNRTSIFVQGCDIRCVYCHNPETQNPANMSRTVTVSQILSEIKPYFPYIRGITVSGGEPTLYYRALTVLFSEIHKLNRTCYIDSNGYFDRNKIQCLIDGTDKFLFDVKTVGRSKELLGVEKTGNIENLKYLLKLGKVEEVRTVVIDTIGDAKETIFETASLLADYPDVLYRIIKVHSRGSANAEIVEKNLPQNKEMGDLGNLAQQCGVQKVWVQL